MKALTVLFAAASLFSFQAAKAQMNSGNSSAFSKEQLTAVQSDNSKGPAVTEMAGHIQAPKQAMAETPATEQVAKPYQFTSAEFSKDTEEQMFRLKVRYANLQYQIEMLKAELESLKQ